ncbi:MAG TPA: DUF433 domain-containing protein [Rhodothermales bacterium]|nr:DUF433 domain-containing protein [Rhodothermales bacterium]
MAETAPAYPHLALGEGDVPIVAGTTMKVVELVTEYVAYGWSPEELHFQHPYLSLGQIHAALGYYWDHQEEMDAEIADRDARAERLRLSAPVPDVVAGLRPGAWRISPALGLPPLCATRSTTT